MPGRREIYRYLHRHRDEIILFLAFLTFTSLFMTVYGWNEYSRMELTRAFVDDRAVEITPYHNRTGDKILIDGEYYSSKPPLSSIVGIPAYILSKPYDPDPGGYFSIGTDVWGNQTVLPVSPETLYHVLFILFTAAIPGAILLVLVKRRIEQRYQKKTAILTAIFVGFGTLLFLYSTLAFGVTLAALLAYLSYIFALRDPKRSNMILAGVFGGLAVSTVYYAAIVPAILFLYLLYDNRESALWYAGGCLVGALPLILYQAAVSGTQPMLFGESPFKTVGGEPVESDLPILFSPQRADGGAMSFLSYVLGYTARISVNALKILFYPVRGLFFYSPILLIAFIGMYKARKSAHRIRKTVLPLAIFLSYLAFNASLANWFSGHTYGPRYLIITLPFLALPLAHAVSEIRWQKIAAVLLPVGIFQNLVGTHGPIVSHGSEVAGRIGIEPGHFAPVGEMSWDIMVRILPPHSLGNYVAQVEELFIEGPSMSLVETAVSPVVWDIRGGTPRYPVDIPLWIGENAVLSVSLNWLILSASLLLVAALYFRKVRSIREHHLSTKLVILVVAIALVSLPMSLHNSPETAFEEGWYPDEERSSNWMRDSGVLHFWQSDESSMLQMDIEPYTELKGSELELVLNGKHLETLRITDRNNITIPVKGVTGYNRLEMRSVDGCYTPALVDNESSDRRCISFRTHSVSAEPADELIGQDETVFGYNWYGDGERRWMSQNGTIHVNPSEKRIIELEVFPALPGRESRYLSVYKDGEKILDLNVSERTNISLPLEKGSQTLKIHSRDGCRVPAKVSERSDESRCISFQVRTWTFSPNVSSVFHRINEGGSRWREKEELYFASENLSGKAVKLALEFEEPYNHSKPKILELLQDGETISERTIYHSSDIILDGEEISSGIKTLKARLSCESLECPRFKVSNASIYEPPDISFGKNWYDVGSSESDGKSRWMSQNATVHLSPGKESLARFNLSIDRSLSSNQELSVYVDGDRKWNRNIAGEEVATVPVDSSSSLTLHSEGGCVVPSQVKDSSDDRCLSFRVGEMEIMEERTDLMPPTKHSDPEDDHVRYLLSNISERAYIQANFSMEEEGVPRDIVLQTDEGRALEKSIHSSSTVIWSVDVNKGVDTFRISENCTQGCSLELEGIELVDELSDVSYELNWYDKETGDGEEFRWTSQDGTLFFDSDEPYIAEISLDMSPFLPDSSERNLSAYWNEKMILQEEVDSRETFESKVVVREGINILRFRSEQGCQRPSAVSGSDDDRCLSFSLFDFKVEKTDDVQVLRDFERYGDFRIGFDGGWYDREESEEGYRVWSPGNGSFDVRVQDAGRVFLGPVRSYIEPRNLTIRVDRERTIERSITPNSSLVDLNLTAGLHTLNLTTPGCDVPAETEEDSTDDRCLSFALEDLPKTGNEVGLEFLDGWHDREESEGGRSWRWMKDAARIFYTSDGSEVLRISTSPYSELQNKSLRFRVNGEEKVTLSGNISDEAIMLTSDPGGTFLELESLGGCGVPAQVEENSTDDRCLGFRMDQFSVQEAVFGEGWHGVDKTAWEDFRWMKEEGTIKFPSSVERMRMSIVADPYPLLPNKSIRVYLNNNSLGTFTASDSDRITIDRIVETDQGLNVVELQSVEGCSVPADMEDSDDQRCISFDLEEASFSEIPEDLRAGS